MIVQFIYNDIETKSLILILVMGIFCYCELKSKPYCDKRLNRISLLSILMLLISVFLKLLAFSIMEDGINLFSDICIIILNGWFFAEIALRLIIDQKRNLSSYIATSILKKQL